MNKFNRNTLLLPVLSIMEIDSVNDKLREYYSIISKEIESLPQGVLLIRYRNNKPNFSVRSDGHTYGLTKKTDIVYKIARRGFLLLQKSLIEQFLNKDRALSLGDILNKRIPETERLLKRYEDAGLDINLIIMTPNQQLWNSNRHSQKPNRREGLIYPTKDRVYMRSKSEQAIGNLLETLHLPYRYEPRLRIGNITYYPDFIIMLPNDKLVILEHVGRMDLAEYNQSFIERMQSYDRANILLGRDVFLSFEHDTRDENLIMQVLIQVMTSAPMNNRHLVYAAQNAGCIIDFPNSV